MRRAVTVTVTVALATLCGCDQAAKKGPATATAAKPGAVGATWTEVRHTSGARFFVTKPLAVGETRRIWLGAVLDRPAENGERQSTTLFDVDCRQLRMRVLEEEAWSQSGAAMPMTTPDSEKWFYPNPDLVAYRVVQMACGAMPISGQGFDSLKDAQAAAAAPATPRRPGGA